MFYKPTEYDWPPIIGFDAEGFPEADLKKISAYRFEIIGFEFSYHKWVNGGHTIGTMHLLQETPTSGIIFHFGSKDFGGAWKRWEQIYKQLTVTMKAIFANYILMRLNGSDPFNGDVEPREVVYLMRSPGKQLPERLIWRTQKLGYGESGQK